MTNAREISTKRKLTIALHQSSIYVMLVHYLSAEDMQRNQSSVPFVSVMLKRREVSTLLAKRDELEKCCIEWILGAQVDKRILLIDDINVVFDRKSRCCHIRHYYTHPTMQIYLPGRWGITVSAEELKRSFRHFEELFHLMMESQPEGV